MHYAPKHNEAALLTAAFASESVLDAPTRTLRCARRFEASRTPSRQPAAGAAPFQARAVAQVRYVLVDAILTPLGFRRSSRVQPGELQSLTVPTLLIWGDHDPVGTVDVAQAVAGLIPDAQLEVVSAGHAVWLGDPKRISGSCARSCAQAARDDTHRARSVSHEPVS
jgi:pimeloyl-ACP methyl ester carboxylesterase